MAPAAEPTSGTELIDSLIDGVRIGDNLVFLGDGAAPLDLLVERFVAGARGRAPLVIVNVAAPWPGAVPDGVTVLDWSPAGSKQPSPLDDAIGVDADLDEALGSLREVDERVGSGAAFVFDRLSAVEAVWGSDAMLELFLSACPRLYRRRSLAVWPVEIAEHRPSFLRRLSEITQVVVELRSDDGELQVTVGSADGRDPDVVGRSVRAEVREGDLVPVEAPTGSRQRLGTLIRDQRLSLGLAQAEVARRVGITPSALSQVERGVRGPSGETLVRLWEVLGVPFGPAADAQPGYRIARRSGREQITLQEGLTAERLVDDTAVGEHWLIAVAPSAVGRRPPFAVKAPEVVAVTRGILDLELDGHTETLHEGDAVAVTNAAITGWANPSAGPAEVLWTIHRRG